VFPPGLKERKSDREEIKIFHKRVGVVNLNLSVGGQLEGRESKRRVRIA